MLVTAAAIGNRFDLDLLALIAEESPAAIQAELGAALGEELVVPLSELEYLASPRGAGLVFRRLRFQHDRVQRAAYALMSPDDQQRMHLQIGRLLLSSAPSGELADRLFEVVSHLNRAAALADPDERLQLARLDVMAARKARGSAAYGAAVEFLGTAVGCFDWHTEYAEQLDAHVLLAECCYLTGDSQRAAAVIDDAAGHVVHNRDRGTLEALRATLHIHAGEMAAAIQASRSAAALLGRPLPDDPAAIGAGIQAAIGDIVQRIGARQIEDLIDLPEMTDLDALALSVVLRNCCPAAFQRDAPLGAYMTAQIVLLALEHGHCATSAYGYCTFAGVLLATPLQDLGYRFGKLGLELNRRRDDRASYPAVAFLFALFSAPWRAPIDEAIRYLRDAARIGREISDHIHGGNAGALEITLRMFRGAEPLAEICHDARLYRQQCREVDDATTARLLTWQIDRIRVLMGEVESLTSEEPDSQITLNATRGEANLAQQFNLLHALVDLTFSIGDEAGALELALATRQLEPSVPRMVIVVDHRFWLALSALAMCRRRPAQRIELEPVIDECREDLARCAEACPANFEAMHVLVEAERSRLASDLEATLALYDRAAASAAQHGRRRLEALSYELHGQLWLDRGKPEIAHLYLARARNLYATLGAQRKVRGLERRHPGLVRNAPVRTSATITNNTAAEVLDVAAIARATRAISGELELDKLLARMLEIIFEAAGAEGGALILEDARGLIVAASRTDRAPGSRPPACRSTGAALPRSIIHYVQRTRIPSCSTTPPPTPVRQRRLHPVAGAALGAVHAGDPQGPAIGHALPRELAGLGRVHPGAARGAGILVSQIAVSLENATLFAAQRSNAEAISRATTSCAARSPCVSRPSASSRIPQSPRGADRRTHPRADPRQPAAARRRRRARARSRPSCARPRSSSRSAGSPPASPTRSTRRSSSSATACTFLRDAMPS